jgi:hypothetical protein
MSGGSLDYACHEMAEIGRRVSARAQTPLHRAFATHLEAVALALHDLEWMLSGDIGEGAEVDAIKACIGANAEFQQLIVEARQAGEALANALLQAEITDRLRHELRHMGDVILEKAEANG